MLMWNFSFLYFWYEIPNVIPFLWLFSAKLPFCSSKNAVLLKEKGKEQ